MQLLILAAVFFDTLLALVAGYLYVNRRALAAAELARAQLQGGVAAADTVNILRDTRLSDIGFLNRLLTGRELMVTLQGELAKAGSARRPGEFVLATVAAACIGLVIGQRANGAAALAGAAIGAAVPWFVLKRGQKARLARFEAQLPDSLDMLVNALKAGYSLQAAMDFVGREVPAPLGPEFARFYDEQRLGIDVRTALLRMQERIDTPDIRMFITSLLTQRETGGNLGEVLGGLATLMRERAAFRGHVETLTAEPKMAAKVLALLPLAAFLLINMMDPKFFKPMLERQMGHYMLIGAAVANVLAYIIMNKIADVDI